jgi:NAD(P)H-flavin reductase
MSEGMTHIYQPDLVRIEEIVEETPDIKTLRFNFVEEERARSFSFRAGQFCQLSVFGEGEATFCLSSSPTRRDFLECSLKRVGKVTQALHDREVGDIIGFRGPYGNWFPLEEMRGKNLIFVGGGIGLAPLRSLIWNCLDRRDEFLEVTILYGARSVADLVYKAELKEWESRSDVKLIKTVDPGGEDESWDGEVGFVPTVLERFSPSPQEAVLITCGPPIMIKFVLQAADKLGFSPDQVITTLEMKMKCGLGKCGRCNIGSVYVCKDGPVFTYRQILTLPPEF